MNGWRSILACLPVVICYVIAMDKPFFWDTIHLASAQANGFYHQGLGNILLPDDIDSGHPPLTGWLLALMWKVAGKGLIQSHLLMLPFLATALWQMIQVIRHYFPHGHWAFYLLFFLNPILLTQSMLVSPDVILFAGFFLVLHGILSNKYWKVIIGSVLLASVSMRGMVCVAALASFGFVRNRNYRMGLGDAIRYFAQFIPSAMAGGGFLLYHWMQKGWIGYHEGSPWSPSFESADALGILKNIVVTIWRMSDQGMLFLWLYPLWIWFSSWKKGAALSARTKELLLLFTLLFVLLVVPQLFYKYLLMHRYLYPCIAVLTLVAFSVVSEQHKGKGYAAVTIPLLLSGFLWIYPETVAKGWDIMPLHYSYYRHRDAMMEKMEEMKIDPTTTGAGFPYEMPSSVIDLGKDEQHFAQPDLQRNKYVLYSNVSNDFSEEDVATLKREWTEVHRSGKWPVYFVLYQTPNAK